MIGVRFNRAMRPFGAGDTALLPDDVAQTVVDEGAAELYEFPAAPHATSAVPNNRVMSPAAAPVEPISAGRGSPRRPRQTYLTKEG